MVWVLIYLFGLIFIILLMKVLNHIGIKTVRIMGFELSSVLFYLLCLVLLFGVFIFPAPQYYIKPQRNEADSAVEGRYSLNRILEQEARKSGIEFDRGSFKILDSHGMHFNHLFLCSYQIHGEETVRVFHFVKDIFGNMKPEAPLKDAYIIPKDTNQDSYFRSYVKDGIFGGYMVTAGFASEATVLNNYRLNGFEVDELHPSGYFLWVELVDDLWKYEFV